jgi:hypothetical protein
MTDHVNDDGTGKNKDVVLARCDVHAGASRTFDGKQITCQLQNG